MSMDWLLALVALPGLRGRGEEARRAEGSQSAPPPDPSPTPSTALTVSAHVETPAEEPVVLGPPHPLDQAVSKFAQYMVATEQGREGIRSYTTFQIYADWAEDEEHRDVHPSNVFLEALAKVPGVRKRQVKGIYGGKIRTIRFWFFTDPALEADPEPSKMTRRERRRARRKNRKR